ncbi:dinitrogenase iron-molybdenum cofactor biosynthesis protein [candidate division KSB1 bacterium]|nr:MAG: dinitrogenase iron-molybdenum cofactor biosynthesis protein [candidate division KSB1 bacterium]
MKVAIVTNDGEYVSQHFGRSRYYKIYTIEDNEIKNVEMRERGTGHYAQQPQTHTHSHTTEDPSGRHGYGADADLKHASMAAEIADCDVLIAGGMGSGAYESFKRAGLNVILTDIMWIEETVTALMENKLKNLANERTD